jgi:hypothetical protein
MATRKHSPRDRAFRPEANDLESRQLLSGVVSGTDIDGDTWTLRLVGPGSLSVTKQDNTALTAQTEINTITIGGTDPLSSRLIGTIHKSATGDGKVFFQNFNQLPGRSELFPSAGQAIFAINMPGFWLGNTTPQTDTTTPAAPTFSLPDGAATLRFGGVDRTHNQPAATSSTTSDLATVVLGLPPYGGSHVIIDSSISNTQQVPNSTGSGTTTVQHGVLFDASGRISLFQANSIQGDAAHPPGQFVPNNTTAGTGGTIIFSAIANGFPFPIPTVVTGIKGAIGGQIGYVRVGGNATNLTTAVLDSTGTGIDHIANFSIGGETNNVMLVAPSGARDISFGKGMDTVDILTHTISTLNANRGAINSNVFVDRNIGSVDLGGDAVGTTVLSGYNQNYSTILNTISGFSTLSQAIVNPPEPPPVPNNAQTGGAIKVHVAGNVINSVFAASVQPKVTGSGTTATFTFGDPTQVVLPTGTINARVEGTIDNSTATPSTPTTAFFAQSVHLSRGPATPPNVPEEPFAGGQPAIPRTPGVHNFRTPTGTASTTTTTTSTTSVRSARVSVGAKTPKGPSASHATTGS